MGKYDKLTVDELRGEWNAGRAGPKKAILKAIAKHGTDEAAQLIFECVARQANAKNARTVTGVLPMVGEPAAPYLVELMILDDTVRSEAADHCRELGEAGRDAAREAFFEMVASYDGWRVGLDRQLEECVSDPELRATALRKALHGFSEQVAPEDAAALDANKELLAYWQAHHMPEIRQWEKAWTRQHQQLSNLLRLADSLAGIVGREPDLVAAVEASQINEDHGMLSNLRDAS